MPSRIHRLLIDDRLSARLGVAPCLLGWIVGYGVGACRESLGLLLGRL